METLRALQEKIETLITFVKELKVENKKLEAENKDLQKKMKSVESTASSNEQDVKELSEERARTKVVVEDLIESINAFMLNENQP